MQHIEFENITTSQIDAQLNHDVLDYQDKCFKIGLVVYLILIFIFRGFFTYWFKFGFAFPAYTAYEQIKIDNDPIQTNYTDSQQAEKTFMYTSLLNGHKIKIIPMAHYEMSCMPVAYNHDFLFIDAFFDSAALYDLGCAWGKMGNKEYYRNNFRSYSAKNEMNGSRVLWTEAKHYIPQEEWEYARTHYSHTHIVPANKNIMGALLSIKTWQNVKLEGELIDMEYIDKSGRTHIYKTSMSRTDREPGGDRGHGSCETLYLTQIQIGNKVYK